MSKKEKKHKYYSYSSLSTYMECGMKYKLLYIDNLTEDCLHSHFFLGHSLDEASSVIFQDKMKDNPVPFDRNRMIESYIESSKKHRHLGVEVDIPKNPLVNYSKGQVQIELLEQEDADAIFEYADELEFELDSIESYVEHCQGKGVVLSDGEKSLYNYICWHTYMRKAIMLLDELKKWSDENIKEVISIQRKFEIENEEGDILVGYMDLEAVMMDDSFRLLDLKTASNPKAQYPDGCIDTAMQLHIYSQESSNLVGYVILDKAIRVREPRVRTRTVLGEVSEEVLDETFEMIDNAIQGIKAGEFEKNKDACFAYGSKCFGWNYCMYGNKKGMVSKYRDAPKKEKNNFSSKVKK